MHIRIVRWSIAAALFTVAFIINPAYVVGCASNDEAGSEQLAKIEADLVAKLDIIDGTPSWTFIHDGEEHEALLALRRAQAPTEQAALPRFTSVAHACGSHTFYMRASACATSYSLPIEGTLTIRKLSDEPATIASDLEVTGSIDRNNFDEARLDIDGHGELVLYYDDGAYRLAWLRARDLGADSVDLDYEDYE